MTDTFKKRTIILAIAAAIAASVATPSMAQTARTRNMYAPGKAVFDNQQYNGPQNNWDSSYLQNGIECMTDPDGRGHYVPCSGTGGS
jgi:hypothetical protein